MQVIVGRSHSTFQDPIGYGRSLPTKHFNRLLPLPQSFHRNTGWIWFPNLDGCNAYPCQTYLAHCRDCCFNEGKLCGKLLCNIWLPTTPIYCASCQFKPFAAEPFISGSELDRIKAYTVRISRPNTVGTGTNASTSASAPYGAAQHDVMAGYESIVIAIANQISLCRLLSKCSERDHDRGHRPRG